MRTFPSRRAADVEQAKIFEDFREEARKAGHQITPEGFIVAVNAATGLPVPEALTTRWAEPEETDDGSWSVPPGYSWDFRRAQRNANGRSVYVPARPR